MKRSQRTVALGLVLVGGLAVGCAAPLDADQGGARSDAPDEGARVSQELGAQGIFYLADHGFVRVWDRPRTSPTWPTIYPSCTGTLLDSTWVLTTKRCTNNRGLLPDPNAPAVPSDVHVDIGTTSVDYEALDVVWHPTSNVALIKLRSPVALTTAGFTRNFFRGRSRDLTGSRVICFGQDGFTYPYQRGLLARASFLVGSTSSTPSTQHTLSGGLGTDPAYLPLGAFFEPSDEGGACVTSEGDLASFLASVSVPGCTGGCSLPSTDAENVETFREWTLDTMHLSDNRRARGTVRLQNAAVADCIDVPGGSAVENGVVNHYPCHQGQNQRWYQEPVDGGGMRLVSAVTGKCLESTTSLVGGSVVQASCDPRRIGQIFDAVPSGTGLALVSRLAPLGCVEVPSSGAAPLRVGGCDPSFATLRQRWLPTRYPRTL